MCSSTAGVVSVPASLVKALRMSTGAGILDCKNALEAANLDLDQAIEILRKKGVASASKLSSRNASQGVISIALDKDLRAASMIKLNAETDFVVRNELFQTLAKKLSNAFLSSRSEFLPEFEQSELKKIPLEESKGSALEAVEEVIATVKENIKLEYAKTISIEKGKNGVISSYVHNQMQENVGEMVALVGLESEADVTELRKLGDRLAMHAVAAGPQFISIEDAPEALIEKEKRIARESVDSATKQPEHVIERIIEGKLNKALKEFCLMEQEFALGDVEGVKVKKLTIAKLIQDHEIKFGHPIKVTSLLNFRS